jgi:hypothetical protein
MRKILITGAAATILALFVAATASASGARLTVPPGPVHTFTLSRARQLVNRDQRSQGFPLTGMHCFWATLHRAGCEGTWTGVVLVGGQPETLMLVDWVTRAGACSTPVVRRTGHESGIAHSNGRGRPHNCFNGPLVVEVGPTLPT